jgi:hypothetical protein
MLVCNLRDSVGTAGNDLVAAVALPDTGSLALHGVLSAEGASVTLWTVSFAIDGVPDRGVRTGRVVEFRSSWSAYAEKHRICKNK